MKWLSVLLFVMVSKSAFSVQVDRNSARLGVWTQDYEAAKKLAAKHKIPMLVNFTGSDWCRWCILMDQKVFDKKAWQKKIKTRAVLVWIDFPRDASRVPAKYRKRNRSLMKQFAVRGFPTFKLLDYEGPTELASPRNQHRYGITPQKFWNEIHKFVKYSLQYQPQVEKKLTRPNVLKLRAARKQLVQSQLRLRKLRLIHKRNSQPVKKAAQKERQDRRNFVKLVDLSGYTAPL